MEETAEPFAHFLTKLLLLGAFTLMVEAAAEMAVRQNYDLGMLTRKEMNERLATIKIVFLFIRLFLVLFIPVHLVADY